MKRHLISLGKLLISVGLLLVLVRKFNMSFSAFNAARENVGFLVLASFLPFTIIPLVSVNRWKTFLRLTGVRENFFTLWKINMVSMFEGLILPSTQGFDALRMYHIGKRHPEAVGGAAASVIIERLIGVLVFCGIALTGLPLVGRYAMPFWPVAVSVTGFVAVACGVTVALVSNGLCRLYSRIETRSNLSNKVIRFLNVTHEAIANFPYRKVLISSTVLIILFQLSTILCVHLLFCACGFRLPYYMHMAFYPVIAIIAMMPVTIGGFGVREGAFAYFYSLVGVPVETAVCVSILNYVVLCLLPASIGGVLWLWDALTNRGAHGMSKPRGCSFRGRGGCVTGRVVVEGCLKTLFCAGKDDWRH